MKLEFHRMKMMMRVNPRVRSRKCPTMPKARLRHPRRMPRSEPPICLNAALTTSPQSLRPILFKTDIKTTVGNLT